MILSDGWQAPGGASAGTLLLFAYDWHIAAAGELRGAAADPQHEAAAEAEPEELQQPDAG